MKPSELYSLCPTNRSNDIYLLSKHIPEVDFHRIDKYASLDLECRFYADHCFDGERIWRLFSVWFKNNPFMICQEAGRDGKDYTDSFVTNNSIYRDVVCYLMTLYSSINSEVESTDLDKDIPLLTKFYNNDLSRFYDPNLKPKYKVGDLLLVSISRNHLRDKSIKITARVKIEVVHQYNPLHTYHGIQIDRRWDGRGYNDENLVIDRNNGTLYCQFNDSEVQGYSE